MSAVWIKDILASLDYEVGEIDKQTDVESFVAKHSINPNWWVQLRKSIRVLTFTSPWNIRSPGMLEHAAFFKAINSMNAGTVAVQCCTQEPAFDALNTQVPLFITDTVTKLDVIAFNELAISIVRRAIAESSFQKFFKK